MREIKSKRSRRRSRLDAKAMNNCIELHHDPTN
jgi:hypothetical protein